MASGNGEGFDKEEVADIGRKVGGSLRKNALRLIGLVVLVFFLYSSYYQIEPEERGLVTRFGKYIHTVEPGPHLRLPFGMDRVIKLPVQRQLKQEFGFRTKEPGTRTEYEESDATGRESRMLTGDLNVANVEWIIQYKIRDPKRFVFRVRNVDNTLRDISEAAMRQVVGDHSVTEVLTVGREKIQTEAKHVLQELCDRYETGVEIEQLVLQDVNPPEQVRDSFNEVNQAIQERERMVNQAWAKYNSVIPETKGKALQTLQNAEGYATDRVNRAKGEAARFTALQTEYAKAPAVTRARIYLETMGKVLPEARQRIFIDSQLKGLLPLLPLNTQEQGAKP
jgi:membrane protease subunit HflK